MKSILLREIKSFFGSPMGYLVIAIFLLLNGLFLWVFEGDYNILNSGFADLSPFFTLSPWILIFLIPAVTMRSFSEEKKQGTLELLLTKPLSVWQIVSGKFLGSMLLIVIAIIPTFIYVSVISSLGMPAGNIDMGSTMGSYFGFAGLAHYFKTIEQLVASFGMDSHFKSMGRGVIDTRDILYFVSIAYLFLLFTVYKLKSYKS